MTQPDPIRDTLRRFIGPAVLLSLLAGCQGPMWSNWKARAHAWWHQHEGLSIPETLPLGSTARAHFHTMQRNAEAADFILHRHDFVGSTAELTPAGRDRILEIAARAPSAPFPIVVERSWNNSNPELDEHRRHIVALILADHGVPEAEQRVFVAPSYSRGITSTEAEYDYYQFLFSRGNNGFGGNGFGNNGGNFGGAGFGAGALGGFGGAVR